MKKAIIKSKPLVPRGKKVFVGMSGGVDSSVSAALLKRAGYDVTGVFIKVWQADFLPCTWREERLDAMRVCAKLDIPFLTFDFEQEYKREVVDYMIDEYKAGHTPNPDVMCNRHVKFGAFWREAKKRGADFIATGHYAQVRKVTQVKKSGAVSSDKIFYQLLTSNDIEKDQTYFLWTLTQEDLSHTLFPVGHLRKPQVRTLAVRFGLSVADKKDSQGLCFMGHVDIKDFLKHYLPARKGNVLDKRGRIIGTHDGAQFYTIGQRHGFAISASAKTIADTPLYIVARDVRKNTLTVAPRLASEKTDGKEDEGEKSPDRKIILEKTVWNDQPVSGKKYLARIRYRQPLQRCVISLDAFSLEKKKNATSARRATILFEKPQTAVSRGQSLVLYSADGKQCLGGGVID